MIIGWPATKADPAAHLIREAGTIPGAYRFECAPYGKPTGLCVSDPGYDSARTGLRHGLVLRAANNGPWQQWYPMGDGRLARPTPGPTTLICPGKEVTPGRFGPGRLLADDCPPSWS